MQLAQFQVHADVEERHWWFLARRKIMQELLHVVVSPPSKDIRILEVGCGTGGNTHFFNQEYTCVGVDPSPDAIAFARSRFPDCRFIQGYAPDSVMEECHLADVLLLLDVLEHVENDIGLVQSLLHAMKPGAYLLMMAPADMSLWSPHDAGFEHFRRYDTPREFAALWQGQPVEVLLNSYCNSRLYPIVKSLRFMSRITGKAWGPADTDLGIPPKPVNDLLYRIFAGESRVLRSIVEGRRKRGYSHGVSVMALVRRM